MIANIDDSPPPEWIPQLIEIVSNCITNEDPVRWLSYLHEGGTLWHLEAAPTLYEEDGDQFLRGYQVHITPILDLIENAEVLADPEELSITGTYMSHPVHLVLMLQPDDEFMDDAEEDNLRESPTKQHLLN